MLDRLEKSVGMIPITDIDRAMIIATRDSLTPGAAKTFVDTLRGLFKWAKEAGHVDDDPTQGVKVQDAKTEGHHTWTDAEIAAFEARWPIGTRQRLWLCVLLYTGLRLSDAISLSAASIKNNAISVKTSKTRTPVIIPVHPELKAILDASPLGKDTLMGVSADAFDKAFRRACRAAGVKGSAHGLRKAAAARLAEAGASVAELNAVFGWTGAKMALRYTEKADRAKLARQAMGRAAMFSPSKGGNE